MFKAFFYPVCKLHISYVEEIVIGISVAYLNFFIKLKKIF